MQESERDFIEKILKETEDVKVPESLKPENIETMLKEHDAKKQRGKIYRFGTLAAACLVFVAGMGMYQSGMFDKAKHTEGAVVNEAVTEVMLDAPEEKAEEKASEEADVSEEKDTVGTLAMAEGYEQIYKCFENYKDQYVYSDEEEIGGLFNGLGFLESKDTVAEAAVEESADMSTSSYGAGNDYSTTNTREEDVDEGDIVKTDGCYLYILKDNRKTVSIVDTQGGQSNMELVSEIDTEDIDTIEEMYLTSDKNQLILIGNKWKEEQNADGIYENGIEDSEVLYCGDVAWFNGTTVAITYDLTNHKNPKEVGRVKQAGSYQTSRLADGYLYLFSNYGVAIDFLRKEDPITYIPEINGKMMDFEDICLPQQNLASRYIVATSIDSKKPSEICESKAILADYGQLYVSKKHIYFYETEYKNDQDITVIRSISYKKGKLTTGHKGNVPGYVPDDFSIDEYKGYLRVITTVYDNSKKTETNQVTVLDEKLDVVGKIENLAKDEVVYSARLMGDTGYFVTFRQTDPLFSVDFSDPTNPKIIGKLKIPGFSEYLHPWGERKLLGIGMDADEETGITNGMKLTMFDISDPSDVKEEDTYLLENYYYSEALYDYKCVLASKDKNVIGLACENGEGMNYLLFSYDDKTGFKLNMEEDVNGSNWYGTRGIYINDMIYVIRGNVIEAYSLKNFEKKDDYIL